MTDGPDILAAALAWHDAGCSVVPVAADGTKRPAVPWKEFQHSRADRARIATWFDPAEGHGYGIGVVCGTVSLGLEMFELEARAVAEGVGDRLDQLVAEQGLAELWESLTVRGYAERSPSGGIHLYYRVGDGPARRNTKLARRPAADDELAANPSRVVVLIETRGEGGYTVVAPTPGHCHPSGNAWTALAGTPSNIPTITAAERDALYAVATLLDAMPARDEPDAGDAGDTADTRAATPAGGGRRPGDDYNARTSWDDILLPAGWRKAHRMGAGWAWRRPGKTDAGISATTGQSADGVDRLYVFSTSTDLPTETPLTKFHAYTLLQHHGDHRAAARALLAGGYGERPRPPVRHLAVVPDAPVDGTAALAPRPGHTGVDLDDSHFADWLGAGALRHWRWAAGLGWLRWTGSVWRPASDPAVHDAVRTALMGLLAAEALAGAEHARIKLVTAALAARRITGIAGLARGVLEVAADQFDAHPDLLNVGNGVVDLSDGTLRPHDPDLLLTKITPVPYLPGATHRDWDTALRAIPEDVREWMQLRLGQAITGHTPDDDIMPILQGSGSNGKSTVLGGIAGALHDHVVTVPERLLLANPNDHPTELTVLRGARLALLEEMPEGRHLNVKRLKDVIGTPRMAARRIRQDNIEWDTTHTLMVTTNYLPRVDETDYGTWRRLCLVRFPYSFRSGQDAGYDPTLRDRVKTGGQGQHEAVLAWLVAGAAAWYAAGRRTPPAPARVRADTHEWRLNTDVISGFLRETVTFDAERNVLATELFAAFNEYLKSHGKQEWSDQLFAERLGNNEEMERRGCRKARSTATARLDMRSLLGVAPVGKAMVWLGLRWNREGVV